MTGVEKESGKSQYVESAPSGCEADMRKIDAWLSDLVCMPGRCNAVWVGRADLLFPSLHVGQRRMFRKWQGVPHHLQVKTVVTKMLESDWWISIHWRTTPSVPF